MRTMTDRLLDEARAATPDLPTGSASSGIARVTYRRARYTADGTHILGGRTYEVGTDATVIAVGMRSVVAPFVTALLAGCCTREACDAWIHRE